jgi:hypothetical protein
MFDMDFFVDLERLLDLKPVYVDQGAAGADAPKTTAIYGTPNIIKHFDKLLGALPLATPSGGARTIGFDEQGSSKAKALARLSSSGHAWLAGRYAAHCSGQSRQRPVLHTLPLCPRLLSPKRTQNGFHRQFRRLLSMCPRLWPMTNSRRP